MITYITAFIFYTLAMVGILLVGFVVYKKIQTNTPNNNKGMIKILDSVAIAPKKVLIVVKVRNEKFLIASGAEHTTFLSKLEDEKTQKKTEEKEISARKEYDLAQNVKIPKQEIRYDDTQKTHNEKIQEQFMTLMAQKDEPLNRANYKDNKREILRAILKDLNKANSQGSSF